MKNLIFTAALMLFAGLAYAGHYHVELINGGSNGYKKCDKQMNENKNTFNLVCSDAGDKNNIYSSLENSKMKEYISKNGWVHNIAGLLKAQQKTLEKTNSMVSRLDSDIFVLARVIGYKTVIDIYTGTDAMNNEHLINGPQR